VANSIDLRSDTLTRPSAAMREAMAQAEVGDDVFGEDPSVNALEARCAELSSKEAAVFLPSGTMANLIACRTHTQPGEEVILEATSHLYRFEAAGFAAVAGVSVALLKAECGLLQPEQIPSAIRLRDPHEPATSLLWLENTHNFGGGSCYDLPRLQALRKIALERGLALHIDGARVFNACVSSGYSVSDVAACADSLSFCFSKGLGCPVGSILVGSRDFIASARRARKMLGGGMRQAGVLAAAALFALDNNIERLADDHRRARQLAAEVDGVGGLRNVDGTVATNLVFLDTQECRIDATTLAQRLSSSNVEIIPVAAERIRLVTHLDVDDSDIERACGAIRRAL
jgi:threonine aldolase